MAYGKVFILILNWNGKLDTLECLESVLNINYPDFEVVVVDNGSSDDSLDAIHYNFPLVTVLENKANLGFAAGNNVGIRYAIKKGTDFIFLLNNDTVVDRNILNELTSAYASLENPGFLGCKIFFFDRPDVIQHFGGGYKENGILQGYHYGEGEKDEIKFDRVIESEYVTGCAMFANRSVIEAIDLLDERFFMYWEDGDWCLRAKAAGFNNYVIPTAKVWHKVSASAAQTGCVSLFYTARNRILLARKHGYGVHGIKWCIHLVSNVLKTRWDQRYTAALFIIAGNTAALLNIYGRAPRLLSSNMFGAIERRGHKAVAFCKKRLRRVVMGA